MKFVQYGAQYLANGLLPEFCLPQNGCILLWQTAALAPFEILTCFSTGSLVEYVAMVKVAIRTDKIVGRAHGMRSGDCLAFTM